ncbi:MAG: hypothetical protein R3C39_02845 [Dehalococcoidia bacterium]
MSRDLAPLRRRPLALFIGRLRAVALLTSWLPPLLILIDRGLPLLQLLAYVVGVVSLAFAYHVWETLKDRSRTALVPSAFRLESGGLWVDVRNVGNASAQTCDVQAWVVPVSSGGSDDSFEVSARRLSPDQRPHYSQRLVSASPGEELRGFALARAAGSRPPQPGRYHLRWRTATIDGHGRRSSLEGWVGLTVAD